MMRAQEHDDRGPVIAGTDLPDILTAAQQRAVTRAVVKIGEDREAIIQASGMLMLVYRIDAEAAFKVLVWRSQTTNTKLKALADQLVVDVLALPPEAGLPTAADFDHLLMTVHERVARLAG